MSNKNTIKSQLSGTVQNTLAPLTNGVAGTSETAFSLNAGPISGIGGGVIPLSLGNPGTIGGTGGQLKIRANGAAVTTSATSCTLTLNLYLIPAAIVAAGLTNQSFTNWKKLATSSARSIANAINSFAVDATVQLTSSGRLQGQAGFIISDLVDAQAAITAATGLLGEQDLNFVLTSTASNSDSGNVITLNEFSLEAV